MEQKHFIDIQAIRLEDTELRERNTKAFHVGDIVQITEKQDGSNACAAYDTEEGKIYAFSRKQELAFNNTLNGFWNFIQNLPENVVDLFKAHPNYRVFGEWSAKKNKIVYTNIDKNSPWYLYDIYDVDAKKWLKQDVVKQFAADGGFNYIHELYYGPFVSWEHCMSFMNSPAYGDTQEGVVVKLQANNIVFDTTEASRNPQYLKIVNDSFKERMKTHEKVIDPEKENAKVEAQRMMESIVTRSRVEKELYKMRDEGILPDKIGNEDFKTVAKHLPKRIYDDIMKEEREIIVACGEFAGKMSGSISMRLAREIVLGQ